MPSFVPGVEGPEEIPPQAALFAARGLDLLVRAAPERRLLTVEEGGAWCDGLHFLGTLDGRACYAGALRAGVEASEGYELLPARALYGAVDEVTFNVAGRAIAVAEWDRTHRFCGRCGTPTELARGERSRRCPRCRTPFYPRIAPAVIVLVQREEEVLLARGANFPRPWFSTLAGFVEPGESLEEAVLREVKEEVGVELSDVRYFGSQPWPYGRSLMIGFNAQYAGGEIQVDPSEIAEARWFRRDAMPQIPPKLSIAHQLIQAWLSRREA